MGARTGDKVSCDLQLGKPEYVAGYISAVSSSTGSSAYYWLAPDAFTAVRAWVTPGDLGIAISNSDEIKATLSALRYICQKAVDVNQRKIAGVRSLAPALFAVEILVEHFGDRRIRAITHSDIEAFKLARLKVLTVRGTTRSIASPNSELQILRAIFNFALRQDWISKNPFNSGASLIS